MNMTVSRGLLHGKVCAPASKSYAHRLLIAAALSDKETFVRINALNEDIRATMTCMTALGAAFSVEDNGIRVTPVQTSANETAADCGESGSTLRFVLPVAAALGRCCTFVGHGRLPQRPNAILTDAMSAHGVDIDRDLLPITIRGALHGGRYEIAGNVSSQYITGLMLALPLCREDSEIVLTTALESASYLKITMECLKLFSVEVIATENGWWIPGNQRYISPETVDTEGDWSGAAFWLTANALGSAVELSHLNPHSVQGDRAMEAHLRALGSTIDVSDTPDLVPALAVAAALYRGETRITGAQRLRIKESDRLKAVGDLLTNLGGDVDVLEDGLVIRGVDAFTGGTVQGCNDHRIVMAAAIAATRSEDDVHITDCEAVSKSYPEFWNVFDALGGQRREGGL